MKKLNKLISLLLSLVMLFSITAGIDLSVFAANGIQTKMEYIAKKYSNGSYFSVNGRACSGKSDNHSCSNCYLRNVSADVANVCGEGYSCWAFANYVFYNVFGIAPTNSKNKVEWCGAGNLNNYAKYGDYIECYDSFGNRVHYFIYLGGTGYNNCHRYESNVDVPNKVAYDRNVSQKEFSSFKIIHSYNYDSINGIVSKPAKPTNLNVKTADEKLNISWNASTGATSYIVYIYSKANCSEYVYKNQVTTTYINNISVKPGRYWIYVHAVNSAGASEGCGPFNYLGCPTNVQVNSVGNKLKVTWNAVQGANCYDVIVTDPSGTTNWYHTTGTDKEIAVSKVGVYSIDVQSLYRPNGNTTGQIVGAHSKAVIYNLNSIETTLAAPIIKAVTNSNGSFTISWDEVANADKYEVYCYNDIYNDYILYKTTTETMITTDIGTPGVTYSYKVKAIDSKNNYAASMFSDSVYVLNEEHIHTWNSGVVTKAATCTANGVKTYTCTKCKATKTEAIKATGHSYDSGKVTKAPTATTVGVKTYTCTKCKATKTETIKATGLKTPVLKATVNANGTIKLSWGKVAEAEKYELYIRQADGSYKLMKTTNATSFTTAFATYGKKFTYKMRAVTGNVKSAYSAAVNATNTKKLQTPTMKVTVNANGSFTLSWNKVAGATSYQLYIKQADGSYKLMKTTNATSFTTAFATYGKQFTYKMRAVTSKNSSATSAYSSAVNAKNTKKLQTPTLKVTVNKNGSFKLTWGKVTGATSYQLYIKQANGSYKLMKTTSSTSFTTAVAAKGKTYSYKVRAVTGKNKNATSNYSSVVNAKRK